MKRTHKLKATPRVAEVIATAPSVAEAARRLGVNPSSIFRWIRASKTPAPASSRRAPSATAGIAGPNQSPQTWADAVWQSHVFTPTEAALVDLASDSLALSRDPAMPPALRIAAAGRFQSITRQLNLEEDVTDGKTATPPSGATVRPWPRRHVG